MIIFQQVQYDTKVCLHATKLKAQINSKELICQRHLSTSTAKRAQTFLFRASITPFNIVNPSPLMKSAISRKKPRSSQSIYVKCIIRLSLPWCKVIKNEQQEKLYLPLPAVDEVGSDPPLWWDIPLVEFLPQMPMLHHPRSCLSRANHPPHCWSVGTPN